MSCAECGLSRDAASRPGGSVTNVTFKSGDILSISTLLLDESCLICHEIFIFGSAAGQGSVDPLQVRG